MACEGGKVADDPLHEVPVREVMDVDPPVLSRESSLCAVARVLCDRGHVWISESPDSLHICGVVTDKNVVDLLSPLPERCYTTAIIRPKSLDHIQVARAHEFMTHPVLSCSPEDTVEDALTTMEEGHVRILAVIERGEMVGEVSLRRVLERFILLSCPLEEPH